VRKFFLIVLSSMLMLVACGSQQNEPGGNESTTLAPVPAEYAGLINPLGPDAASGGEKVFSANCAMCHGSQGHGDGPAGQSLDPRPKNLAGIQAAAGDDFLFWRIREGKPGTAMVAWKGILSDEQIWQTVSFIRTLK
jgi:mono/diheme cytochrome c family protein